MSFSAFEVRPNPESLEKHYLIYMRLFNPLQFGSMNQVRMVFLPTAEAIIERMIDRDLIAFKTIKVNEVLAWSYDHGTFQVCSGHMYSTKTFVRRMVTSC